MRRVGVLILLALAVATGISGIALAEHAADGTPGAVWDAPDTTAADTDLDPLSDVLQEDDDEDDEDDEEREDEDEQEEREDDKEDESEEDEEDDEEEEEAEHEEEDEEDEEEREDEDEHEAEEDDEEDEDEEEEDEHEEDEEDGRRGNNEPNGNSHNNGQNGDNGRNGNNGNGNNGRNGNNGNGQQGAAGQDDQDDDRAGGRADQSDDDGDETEGEEDVDETAEDETDESDGDDEDGAVGDETSEQDEEGTSEQDEGTSEQDETSGGDGADDSDEASGAGDSDGDGQDDGGGEGTGDSDEGDQNGDDTTASLPSSVNRSASATATTPSGEATFSVPTATLGKTSITAGENVRIRMRVENTGEREGSYEVVLRVDESRVATEAVTVGPGGTETIVFNYQVDEPGEYEIAVGEQSLGTLTVTAPGADGAVTTPDNGSVDVRGTEAVEVAEATTADDWVREGYETTVRATVVNTSNRTVTRALTVTVDGQPVANRSVTLQSGERDEVTIAFDAVNGTVAVEGVDAGRIAVGERFGGTETRIDGTAEGTGLWAEFGLAVFLGVLISAGALGLGKE